MTSRATDAGFTLIEVLLALVVLGLAAGIAFTSMSSGVVQLQRARAVQDAISLGESMLARIGPEIPLKTGRLAGMQDRRNWQIDIGSSLSDPPPADGLAAYHVHVAIYWHDDRGPQQLLLDSVRLGPEQSSP